MASAGRKGIAEEWLKPEKLLVVQSWARDGLTDKQIAHNMGIGYRTLYEWKNRHAQFAQALKNGKDVVDAAVENSLLKAAMAGEAWAVCFWLKNRRPDRWRDKPDADQGTNLTIVIKDDYGDDPENN